MKLRKTQKMKTLLKKSLKIKNMTKKMKMKVRGEYKSNIKEIRQRRDQGIKEFTNLKKRRIVKSSRQEYQFPDLPCFEIMMPIVLSL